jgi:hypothetical protein
MYRVVVESRGKYNNAVLGARYCFTKRSTVSLAAGFMEMECDCKVEKFVRLHHDIFSWSAVEVGPDIWDKIYEACEKLKMEEQEDAEVL